MGQIFLKSIILYSSCRHSIRPSFARTELREIIHFGGGFTLSRILSYGAKQGDYFVIGRVLDAASLGIYTRAYQLMMLPAKYFGEVLNKVLFPIMSKTQSEQSRLKKMYLTSVAMSSLFSAPSSVLMIILAGEIVMIVLGSKWLDVILPFQVLALGVLPRISYKVDDTLARALGAMYRRSARDAIYAFLVIIGSWFGLKWGLSGAAAGVLIAVVINHILAIRMSKKLIDCRWSEIISAQLPSFSLAAVVLVVAFLTKNILIIYNISPLIIFLTTVSSCGLALLGIFYWRPQILGVYGTEALSIIFNVMPVQLLPKKVLGRFQTITKNI
jgi:PST family polysaccharide transporter